MSKTVQFKRGNANVSATYVGAQGEITVNTDNYTLNVHDGVRAGGYTILNANVSNIGNLSVTNQTIIGTSANTNITLSPNNASVVLTSNLVTPNIAINRYTIQSVNSGSSLTLPAETDAANVDLTNTFSNIRFTTYDPLTNAPYTLVLNNDSDVIFPGYIKSNLGSAEIQFAGGQGLLMYANFDTGSTGISLNDTGTSDIFANVDLRLTTNYSGAGKQWLFGSNGTLSTTGNLSTANLSISHAVANNTVQVRTLANSDLKLVATDGIAQSAIYLWANNQRMSFNTISNAFDFNFNGQLSATDFTASKNSAYGYSFYAAGGGYSGMRHTSGPPDYISIEHEGNIFAKFISNATVDIFGNLVVSADGQSFGSFPTAFVQVYANVDTYSQMVLQNINDGTSASTDVVVTADNGDDASYYINMGILGSNHASPDFFGDTKNYDDGYLIVVGNDSTGGAANVGNLILGSTNGIVKTFVGNIAEANVVTTVSESLLTVAGNIIPAANVTYGLGTETNQWKDLWLSNTTLYMGGTAITVVDGTLSVGGNVVGGNNYNDSNVISLLASFGSNSIVTTGLISGNLRTQEQTIALGYNTGNTNQGTAATAVGYRAGETNQGLQAVAIGFYAAANTQSANAVAVGTFAGRNNQGTSAVAIGVLAGNSSQGAAAIAIGEQAGNITQGSQSIAIGTVAGQSNQGTDAIAIGTSAGGFNQREGAVAIGQSAGVIDQGMFAVAIGSGAGYQYQANNSIAITATGTQLSPTESGFYIDPVRNDTSSNSQIVTYNTSTKELTYTDTISVTGNISAANLNANVNGFSIGYRDVPQVIFTSNATLALTDAGKHYYSSNSANIITVPNNATVSFNIGAAISIVQQGTANLTITPGSGVTMYLAGNATSSSRLLGNYGMATLMKVDTDTWFINGTGLT